MQRLGAEGLILGLLLVALRQGLVAPLSSWAVLAVGLHRLVQAAYPKVVSGTQADAPAVESVAFLPLARVVATALRGDDPAVAWAAFLYLSGAVATVAVDQSTRTVGPAADALEGSIPAVLYQLQGHESADTLAAENCKVYLCGSDSCIPYLRRSTGISSGR